MQVSKKLSTLENRVKKMEKKIVEECKIDLSLFTDEELDIAEEYLLAPGNKEKINTMMDTLERILQREGRIYHV